MQNTQNKSFKTEAIPGCPHPIYTWSQGPSSFSACPEYGARLMTWDIKLPNGTRNVLYWPKTPDYSALESVRGGNPLLFPFVGRSFHKGKENTWKTPDDEILSMPRNGFARNSQFSLESISESGFTASLTSNNQTLRYYPYQFRLNATYTFEALSMTVALELENHDSDPIPWCAGHHFYFTLPWHQGLSRNDYLIHLNAKKSLKQDSEGKLYKEEGVKTTELLGNKQLTDTIHTKLKSQEITFGPKNGEEDITIRFHNTNAWTSLTTWTEGENAPFYCVEPWMGPPNSLALNKGIHYVNPGESEAYTITVSMV